MKEQLTTKKEKTLALVALGLASFAIAACAEEKGSDNDNGSDQINACPAGYSTGAVEVAGSREDFRADLAKAVTSLSAKLPRTSTSTSGLSEAQKGLVAAGVEIFHQDTIGYTDDFEVDTPENRIDDLSEQFCSQDDKLFVAPETATAIGAMEAAGIDVSVLRNR